ncbi:hypothetical protein ARALYDRAFT_919557 [Arabidopsis lyrata subsp. lyrata]|uniref:Uncharacterized protein n=1 Tax=Arabidopsis lyrata subsp. lyrata TaxID=81972 RepID=D7MMW5_ARALL|nr:hypothetical protein ARALYDRAFT_919557 [Arabidopsis lyrata subsp. lyrata]
MEEKAELLIKGTDVLKLNPAGLRRCSNFFKNLGKKSLEIIFFLTRVSDSNIDETCRIYVSCDCIIEQESTYLHTTVSVVTFIIVVLGKRK